jgi:hypothetical protein
VTRLSLQDQPIFSPLTIADKQIVKTVTSRELPYSDFNFGSLYCWNIDGSTMLAVHHGNLLVSMPDYITGKPVLSVLGDNAIDETLDQLLEITDTIDLVPASVIAGLRHPEHFEITEDRDNFDYLYNLKNLVALAGQYYKKKRNKINHVRSSYGDRLSVATTRIIDSAIQQKIERVFSQWTLAANKSAEDVAAEKAALGRALTTASQLDLSLTTIYLDGEMCGFSLNELLGEYAVCHFEKALDVDINMSSFVAYTGSRI